VLVDAGLFDVQPNSEYALSNYEQALLLSTHIPHLGRLRSTSSGAAWENVL
jgi:hypothetical protein